MSRNVSQRERFAGGAHTVVVIGTPLAVLVTQNGDVNGDFDLRVVAADPLDGGFEVRVAGDDDHGVGEAAEGIVEEVDGNVNVGLFLFGHDVLKTARAGTGLAGVRALLVFPVDNADLRQGAEGLEVTFLAVAPGADVQAWVNQGRKELDGDDFFIQAEGFEEGLDVEPFPSRTVLKDAKIPVESVQVDSATLFKLGLEGVRHRAEKCSKGA
jgi:hypothetical protein